MRMLCSFLLRELLNQSEEEITMTFEGYGDNLRELYDGIIEAINNNPETLKSKHDASRINNIFDDYAGIAPNQRAYDAPAGIKVFKHVGFTNQTGGFTTIPSLTPSVKTPPPAKSLIRTIAFPPENPNINHPQGYTSPTSPGGREKSNAWPMSQNFLDRAIEEGRKVNASCKNPVQQQRTKDVRIGDGSVLNPAKSRSISKSYREAASGSGLDPGRRLPNVALPGQQPGSSSDFKIRTDAPDIKLTTPRDITQDESNAWLPRIDQASKEVANFLRHGASDQKYNIHSSDGYVRVSILVQLPQFRQHKIDAKILEVILMHGRQANAEP